MNCRLIYQGWNGTLALTGNNTYSRGTTINAGTLQIGDLLPGRNVLAWTIHLVLDISIVTLLFAMIFKFLPDARLAWRDVRLGAALTTALFLGGKYALGFYLGDGAPGSGYKAAGSLTRC